MLTGIFNDITVICLFQLALVNNCNVNVMLFLTYALYWVYSEINSGLFLIQMIMCLLCTVLNSGTETVQVTPLGSLLPNPNVIVAVSKGMQAVVVVVVVVVV